MSSSSESDEQEASGLSEDYYAILNIPRDATDKQIVHAYHKFGRIYHPDKQNKNNTSNNISNQNQNNEDAELLFAKIKRVYDVLIDPHKRAIYDSVGVKGLAQNDLQIVIRSKTPQEIREEYERLSRDAEERRLQKLTYSQGHFSMQVDAVKIFDKIRSNVSTYSSDPASSQAPLAYIRAFEMEQSIDFPLTSSDTVTLAGSMNSQEQYGAGSVTANLRRVLQSGAYLDFKGSLGANRSAQVVGFKQMSKRCNASVKGLFKYRANGTFGPLFTSTCNYQLDDHLVGQLQYKTSLVSGTTGGALSNVSSAMSTSLVYEKDELNVTGKVQLSIKNTYISLSLSRKFMQNDLKLKSMLQYGYLGATFSYGVEKQVTKFSRIDASMVINSVAGVSINLEVQRSTQTFIVPIHLSYEVVPSAVFYGTITPIIGYYLIKKLVVDPYLKNKDEIDFKQKQEKLKSEIIEKKRLAKGAQNLMRETVARILEKEGPNGLIITKAFYGKISKAMEMPSQEGDKVVDVQVPLQFLVNDRALQIMYDQAKSSLEGFYDPCIGEVKSLYIEYTFNGEPYKTLLAEKDIVRLPRQSHKVQWWSRPFSSVKASTQSTT